LYLALLESVDVAKYRAIYVNEETEYADLSAGGNPAESCAEHLEAMRST
jgi:hypothetical protein